eukprot:scaffold84133_cov61-Attheya_sp.AAC.4
MTRLNCSCSARTRALVLGRVLRSDRSSSIRPSRPPLTFVPRSLSSLGNVTPVGLVEAVPNADAMRPASLLKASGLPCKSMATGSLSCGSGTVQK